METSKGVRVYGIAIIVYGAFNLLGVGSFSQYSVMFEGLNRMAVVGLYIFTIFYGICGVYCGTRVLRLEDWARKVIIGFTSASIVLGFLINRLVLANLKDFFLSGQPQVPPDQIGAAYSFTIFFMVLATMFELSIVFFFTRPGIAEQFRHSR